MKSFANTLKETQLNKPSAEALALPFYPHLPKDEIGLMVWRVYVRERALTDEAFRQTILQMCAVDPAFFIVTFVDIHETRGIPRNVPFFMWADQVDVVAWVAAEIGQRDMVVSKSRAIGMSWTFSAIFIWVWLFVPGADLAMVSKDEDSLDLVGRPSTLMGKLDYIYKHLPFWMRTDADGNEILRRVAGTHLFQNTLNGASIIGYVPTDQKLRGGRFFAVLFDEFAFVEADDRALMAATQLISFCRIWLSTFNGMGNMFHRLAHDDKAPLLRIRTFWWNNPFGAAGMYTSKHGIPTILDKTYRFPDGYNFIADGTTRSPFFDYEMSRAGSNPQAMLEELNGVAAAATRKLFQPNYVAATRRHLKVPVWRGRFSDDGEWIEDWDGPWRFWRFPSHITNDLAVAADPASGSASGAYAALTGLDIETGEQVFTFSDHLTPIELARVAVRACESLTGPGRYAILSWEVTGIGVTFTNEVLRLRYPRVYKDDRDKVGYANNDAGEAVLWELGRALYDGELVLYDERIAEELELFEYDRDGELQWAGTDGHADRAMAFAITWNAAKTRRKAILRESKRLSTISMLGADAEPDWVELQRQSAVWSSRFFRRR